MSRQTRQSIENGSTDIVERKRSMMINFGWMSSQANLFGHSFGRCRSTYHLANAPDQSATRVLKKTRSQHKHGGTILLPTTKWEMDRLIYQDWKQHKHRHTPTYSVEGGARHVVLGLGEMKVA
jgi:hypothetical protein